MGSATTSEFDDIVIELRADLTYSNRNSRDNSVMIEVDSESRYFSLGESEYRFLCQLDGQLTLREAFAEFLQEAKQQGREDSLSWDKAIQLFKFLHLQKLLAKVNGTPVSAEEGESSKQLVDNVNPYGFRLKLFDADSIAARLAMHWGGLFQRFAFAVWAMVTIAAVLLLLGNPSRIVEDTKVIIQPQNWIWLTLCWVFLKVIHESAHAVCCKRMGGRVGEAGINFLLFLPMPYVDVSSSWKFESKWKRIYVALAGIYAELFIAAVCVFVWAFSSNPVWESIAVQMILMASLSTVLFNINPLMRFDGYYVLSDLLGRPNLGTNGAAYQKNWIKKTFLGIDSKSCQTSFDAATKIYGWLAAIWKIVIAVGLLIAAAKLFHGAGIVLALAAIVIWYVKPLVLLLWSIVSRTSPVTVSLSRCLTSLTAISLLVWFSTWVPWPFAPSAVGTIEYADQKIIRAPSDGFLVQIKVKHGQYVSQGDQLVEIENRELSYKYRSLKIDRDLAVTELREYKRDDKLAEYQAQQKKIHELDQQLKILRQQTGRLSLVAPQNGFVVADDLSNRHGAFYKQGDEILKVIASDSLEVVSCASEFDIQLFRDVVDGEVLDGKVTVVLESGQRLESEIDRVEPTASHEVIHPALSAENGGPLAVKSSGTDEDSQELELTQPVFKVTTVSLSDTSYSASTRPKVSQLKVGQRCRVYLKSASHSCFHTLCHKLNRWLRDNWEQGQ